MSPSVEQVIVISRHGQRWPMMPLRGVPLEFPLAEITPQGREQLFEMGRTIAGKWPHILGQVHAFHSEVSRCKQSLEVLVRGMGLKNLDIHGLSDVNISKRNDLEKDEVRPLSFGMKTATDHISERDMAVLKEFLRQTAPSLIGFEDDDQCFQVMFVLDAVTTLKANGIELPLWIEENYSQLATILNEIFIAFTHSNGETFFNYLAPFLVEDLQKIRSGLSVYVVSDIHLSYLLVKLGLPMDLRPPFGASVQIEIFDDDSLVVRYENSSKQFTDRNSVLRLLKSI